MRMDKHVLFFEGQKIAYSCCISNFPGPNGAVVRRRYSREGNRPGILVTRL